jgi:hypothetical protein
MKNVIFTYDSRAKGEEGEACMTILLDDDRAAVVKAAYDNRQGSSEIEDILLRCKVEDRKSTRLNSSHITISCGARSMTCAPLAKHSGGESTFATASSAWRSRRLEP